MEYTLDEIYFLKSAFNAIQIKASDAHLVSKLMDKLDQEFIRAQMEQEQQSKKEAAQPVKSK